MTVQEYMINRLVQNGMFDTQATKVIEMVKAKNEGFDFWGKEAEGYPDQLLSVVWFTVKRNALEWIDENLPRAWFRPMFVTEKESE